jgi:hypothetical protein
MTLQSVGWVGKKKRESVKFVSNISCEKFGSEINHLTSGDGSPLQLSEAAKQKKFFFFTFSVHHSEEREPAVQQIRIQVKACVAPRVLTTVSTSPHGER